jgi:tetratricopeptide (TPR) repeat protein
LERGELDGAKAKRQETISRVVSGKVSRKHLQRQPILLERVLDAKASRLPWRKERVDEAHLTLEALARLLSGGMTYEEIQQRVVPHLLELCPVCRETHREILRMQEEVWHWNEEIVVIEGLEAPELWARIADLPYEKQVKQVEEDAELQAWGLCQLLLKKSLEAGFKDPTTAVNLANLAVKISCRLGDVYHPEWVHDLRARALAHLGNSRRVLGELRSADDAFRFAESFLEQGTGDPRLHAEILNLLSSLRWSQRNLDEALKLSDAALSLYRASADARGVGTCLVKKANILQERGDLGRAIRLLSQRAEEIQAAGDHLNAYARFNLLGMLALAQRYEEAERILPEVRTLFHSLNEPLNLIRLVWTEGTIALGRERIDEAESNFCEVQSAFLERGMAYDAALVSLDLALVYLRKRKLSDLKKLSSDLVLLFESRDVHREALGALYLFQKACEEEKLTEQAVNRIAERLRQNRPLREV